jgi:integrase-like protein
VIERGDGHRARRGPQERAGDESPESNGMTEAFVKTFKRDDVRVSPIRNAAAALALIDQWMEDYNTVPPHSRLGYRSLREYIHSQPVACPLETGSTPHGHTPGFYQGIRPVRCFRVPIRSAMGRAGKSVRFRGPRLLRGGHLADPGEKFLKSLVKEMANMCL